MSKGSRTDAIVCECVYSADVYISRNVCLYFMMGTVCIRRGCWYPFQPSMYMLEDNMWVNHMIANHFRVVHWLSKRCQTTLQ